MLEFIRETVNDETFIGKLNVALLAAATVTLSASILRGAGVI